MKVTLKDYKNDVKPDWCAGCGDFSVLAGINRAVVNLGIKPENVVISAGIGCSGKISGYTRAYGVQGSHGRSLPIAQGIKLANQDLTVFAMGGDGDGYAIGIGHAVHAMKRNVNMTYVVMDNHVYGLTKGQASPRSDIGFVTKTTPHGAFESPLSVCETAIAAGATFVAQSYMVNRKELVDLIQQAMDHEGFSFINVFSPCVTYNKRNSYDWFKEHLVALPEGYDTTDRATALKTLGDTDGLVTGLIYQNTSKPSFEKALAAANGGPHPRPLTEDVVKPDQVLFDSLCNQFK